MKTKIIYTRWLAYELRKQGFKILSYEINKNNPKLYCWVFEDNNSLQEATLKLIQEKQAH